MPRKGYHHGNLREELVGTALANLKEQRAQDISLRKLAEQVGVDHTAVYRHFKDRDALLAALIEVGYRELNDAMGNAWRSPEPWLTRLHLVVKAYVQYAQAHPTLYEIMFNGALDEANYPALRQLSIDGTRMFVEYIEKAQADGVLLGNEPAQVALTICSLCHGLAQMLVGNQFDGPFAKADADLDRLVDGVVACVKVGAVAGS